MIQFPIKALLSEEECHDYLEHTLHPEGLRCPRSHPLPVGQAPHDPGRAPIFKYKCRLCGAVYHLFTGTLWSGGHYDLRIVTLLMRGFLQGVPTSHLAKELGLDRGNLLKHRRRIQQLALQHKPETPLSDGQTEADEMFQNSGEKGQLHPDPKDPPRRRANKPQGRGTMGNDRPPILGVLGRESGQIRLTVCEDTKQKTLQLRLSRTPRPTLRSTPTKATPTTMSLKPDGGMPRSTTRKKNGRATTTGGRNPGSPLQHHRRNLDRTEKFSPTLPGSA